MKLYFNKKINNLAHDMIITMKLNKCSLDAKNFINKLDWTSFKFVEQLVKQLSHCLRWSHISVQFSPLVVSNSLRSMDCSIPGLPVHHHSWSLLKLMSIESVMPSNHLILYCPLLLLPSIFPSNRVFSNESALPLRWPKYWSFSTSSSSEYSRLVSFRMDWLNLLAVQGTLKSLLQHHSSKTSFL